MELVSLIIQIISALIYTAALFISIKQIRNDNKLAIRQSRNEFFAEYTRRYHDIILSMPDEVYEGVAEPKGKTLKHIQLYFDLCSEEYHLHDAKMIPEEVWDNWVEGMAFTVNNDLYKKAWNSLEDYYNKDFRHFMVREVLKLRNEK